MFRRLKALGIEAPTSDINQDDDAFRRLLVRLQVEIDESKTNQFKLSDRFDEHLPSFLQALDCPYDPSNRSLVIDWCIVYALQHKYSSRYGEFKSQDEPMEEEQTKQTDRLDELNLDDKVFAEKINQLAATLRLLPHSKHEITLRAIALYLDRIASGADDNQISSNDLKKFDLLEVPLGFQTNDPILEKAARILRLLLISDLRRLQNQINQLLVSAQEITAEPKTDTKLGVVGK